MSDPRNTPPVHGNGVIAVAIVVAALILSWGSSNSTPHYQLAGSAGGVVRLDTDSGAMLACDMQQCRQIEQPLRAKTWGPLSVVFDNTRRNVEREQQQQQLQRPQPPQVPEKK
jgi:hypothetical protein